MKYKKLKKVITLLEEYFGRPYDNKSNPSEILDVLIATKLSQNTTDKSSFKAFTNLKKRFKNCRNVSEAGIEEIRDCIKVCGLSNTKAGDIKLMLSSMLNNYGTLDLNFLREYENEKIYEELLQYEGIGVKTISCALIFALGRDVFPVDTHVHRVLNRLGIVRTNTPVKTFEQMSGIIPEGKKYGLHNNLIKFGRNFCRSKNPVCSVCFLYSLCEYEEKKFFKKKNAFLTQGENSFIILEHI